MVSALLVLIPLVQVVALNAEIGSLNKSIKKLSIINDVVNEPINNIFDISFLSKAILFFFINTIV